MHMFSRVGTLMGGVRRPLEWATEVTEKVNSVLDLEVTMWTASFGYPVGTVAWSSMVESRQQLVDETAKLMGDDGYLKLVEKGQEFATTPMEDHLRTIVHMTAEPAGAPPVGASAEIITATPAAGKIGEAMAWGISMTDTFASVTGADSAFLNDAYGTFGQMSWMSVFDSPADVDAAAEATMADAKYMASIDQGGDLFEPGTGQRGLVTRMA
jgi:hypothetical protein